MAPEPNKELFTHTEGLKSQNWTLKFFLNELFSVYVDQRLHAGSLMVNHEHHTCAFYICLHLKA